MCLISPGIKMIAQKDMIVFKTGTNNKTGTFQSDNRYFSYDIGKRRGFTQIYVLYDEVNEGYHSWSSPFKGNATFLIPKGSEYYVGKQYDGWKGYVSTDIIYLGPSNIFTKILYKLGIKTPKYV